MKTSISTVPIRQYLLNTRFISWKGNEKQHANKCICQSYQTECYTEVSYLEKGKSLSTLFIEKKVSTQFQFPSLLTIGQWVPTDLGGGGGGGCREHVVFFSSLQ